MARADGTGNDVETGDAGGPYTGASGGAAGGATGQRARTPGEAAGPYADLPGGVTASGAGGDGEFGEVDGGCAAAADARLVGLLRAETPTVYPALRELRGRHHSAVLAYARRCTTSDAAARQLAAQAFTHAARESARGVDRGVPVRLQLLLLTARLAAAWSRDERAGGLDAGLLLILSTAGADGPEPPLLAAFQSLPLRAQGLLWYGTVEQENDERTARFLGLTREDVRYGTPQALQSMARACLRRRLAASDDPHCGDFRRLIEESVRPENPRSSADLHTHMAHCAHCTAAFEEQSALRDDPRTALAEGLLPWGGTAYVTRRPTEPGPEAGAPTHAGTRTTAWPPSRRYVLASAALGVALTPLLLFVLFSGDAEPHRRSAGAVTTPSMPAQVTVTATVSTGPATPSPPPTSRPPSPTPSPRPTRTAHADPPPPKPTPRPSPAYPPGAVFAQVVNDASGRCLDVAGDFDNGTDVVTAPCGSADTQRWRVDSERGVVQSAADPDFCLDSRGSVDKGVGIWSCDSVDGRNGRNLTFTVDPDGVIRPAIAIETALTDNGRGYLSLEPLSGGAEQRWRAGQR
ncbi:MULTISPECIES: RICIN domain-containing protein [unclassified Streptomyces]|uniref:RICIN domain-containing protein n=1 Tax=unclassified Streptomyces TaxID=2593676 RepID=UPI00274173CE|nr:MULTISPECIES: RICIN domain-containing protein [unclassified Streptomyces]